MLLVVCLLGLFAQSFAQVTFPGSCPVGNLRSSSIEGILGVWYEYARIPNAFETDHVCVNFTQFMSHHQEGVVTMHCDSIIRMSGAWYIWESHFYPSSTDESYIMKFPKYASNTESRNVFIVGRSKQWWVWHMCLDQGETNQQFAWVMSKTRDLGQRELREIENTLRRWKIPMKLLEKTDNTNCPHFDKIIRLPK